MTEISGPLCQTNKISMVSCGQGEVGATKLTNEIIEIVEKIPDVVKRLAGVDITEVRHRYAHL